MQYNIARHYEANYDKKYLKKSKSRMLNISGLKSNLLYQRKILNKLFAINQSSVKIFVIEICKFLISFIMFMNNVILMIINFFNSDLINNCFTIHNNLIHELIILQMFKK